MNPFPWIDEHIIRLDSLLPFAILGLASIPVGLLFIYLIRRRIDKDE